MNPERQLSQRRVRPGRYLIEGWDVRRIGPASRPLSWGAERGEDYFQRATLPEIRREIRRRLERAPCAGAARHWFSVYGAAGLRTPVCVRWGCGSPNPRPLSDEEWAELAAHEKMTGRQFAGPVGTALRAREAQ